MSIDRASDFRRGKGRLKVATSKGRKGKLAAGDKAGGGKGQVKRRLGEGYGEKSKVAGSAGARLVGKGSNKQWVVKEKGASAIKKKGIKDLSKGPAKKGRLTKSKAGNLQHTNKPMVKSVKSGNLGKSFKGAYGGKKKM